MPRATLRSLKVHLSAWLLLSLPALGGCRNPAPQPASRATKTPTLLVIPTPKKMVLMGGALNLDPIVGIEADSKGNAAAKVVADELDRFGIKGEIGPAAAKTQTPTIFFRLSPATKPPQPERYTITVGRASVTVSAQDPKGLYWGAQTLAQLLYKEGRQVKLWRANIDDYPSIAWRGAHLFCGNRALPFHKKLIKNVFSRFKLNNLILECEQVKWDATQDAAPEWGMSKEDLKQDIAFARAHGLNVTPLVNSAGHMPWLLSQEKYKHLAEDPATPYAIRPGYAPTYELLGKLHREVIETFQAKTLHIGADEVALRGRYPQLSKGFATQADALALHLNTIHKSLTQQGVRMAIWGDMLLAKGSSPDGCNAASEREAVSLRKLLPKDITVFDWHYRETDAYPSVDTLRDSGFGIVGATWWRAKNIQGFAKAMAGRGGLLQTTWCGHESSEDNLKTAKKQFVAFVIAAEEAWNGGVDLSRLTYDPEAVFDNAYGTP